MNKRAIKYSEIEKMFGKLQVLSLGLLYISGKRIEFQYVFISILTKNVPDFIAAEFMASIQSLVFSVSFKNLTKHGKGIFIKS